MSGLGFVTIFNRGKEHVSTYCGVTSWCEKMVPEPTSIVFNALVYVIERYIHNREAEVKLG